MDIIKYYDEFVEMENLMQRDFDDPDEEYPENHQSSLERSMMRFLRHDKANNHVLEESPTLRLVKALHERMLEHVILAIEEGACINFHVWLKNPTSFSADLVDTILKIP